MAAGGYFSTGYGHLGKQTAGAVTAVAADAFAGASNPGKLTAVENQYEFGLQVLNPNKKIERRGASGAASIYNFSSNSRNPVFLVPEFAWSLQLDDDTAIGVTVYGNGGLNSEYPDTTGVPGSNTNPEACGDRPGNFLTGCGHAGFDLAQLIVAPTIAWEFMSGHSVGVAPLLAVQRFESFGLQGFTALSREPDKFTNNGHDIALGAGLRIGWYGELKPWLSLGAAYASKIYMQDFDDYQGLFAGGSLDIPANYSFGAAFMPGEQWTVAVDVQRIEYGEVNALSNSVLNSLGDDAPLMGTSSGSGFGWDRNQTNYRFGLTYRASEQLTFRAGYAYGNRPNDNTLDATSFSVLTPNSKQHATLGASWQNLRGSEFHFAYSHYFKDTYRGPSAIFSGAEESVTAHVHILYFAWTIQY
jgi:long-chain fatty acid transport protein